MLFSTKTSICLSFDMLRATLHTSQEQLWPWESKGPSNHSKGCTMGNRNPILQLVGPQAQRKGKWTMSRDDNIYLDSSPYQTMNIIHLLPCSTPCRYFTFKLFVVAKCKMNLDVFNFWTNHISCISWVKAYQAPVQSDPYISLIQIEFEKCKVRWPHLERVHIGNIKECHGTLKIKLVRHTKCWYGILP